MNKPRLIRALLVLALIVFAVVALRQFDLLGLLRRMHGMA